MRKSEIATGLIILLSFILSAYFYPEMPQRTASHWNMNGEVDGYMQKDWGTFLLPIIMLAVGIIFLAIPRIDPLKANIEKFRAHYVGFVILMLLFLLSLHVQVLLWNLGVKISPNATLPLGFAILFYYIGILLEKSKRNWFIGIRTPWTLSSDKNWEKTHKLGGELFKGCGIISLGGLLFQNYAIYLVIVPIIICSLYAIYYSYREYKKGRK